VYKSRNFRKEQRLENNLVKVASIDLGSNSTRLLIADITDGIISPIYKEHQVTRMGDNLTKSKNISKESIKRVIKVLSRFFKTISINGVENIQIVGTAALRDAENSDDIIEQIQKKFDVEVDIVSGEEEGVLTSLGVLHSFENIQNFLIVDIGGRSTEFIYDKNNKIISKSLDIGVVSLSELFFDQLPPTNASTKKAIEIINRTLLESSDLENRLIIGVAGTFTSLASIFLKQDRFNEKEMHLTEISKKDIFEINNSIIQMTEAQIITNFKGIDPKRAKTIQSGILLANEIISKYNVNSIKVSNSDILEGLILKKY
jgi:exopolyphosphatase/guanosine-5'-triphosphate,3'-diphosphate pyrophosphatase